MCGILGVATTRPHPVSVDDATLRRMRDRLAHRGPDGAGLWRCENFALAHRRLAVVDLSEAAHQPMVEVGGRRAISYNGELYNDAELRRELAAEGIECRSRSDTETVLHALSRWGTGAIAKLRGMFALAYVDVDARKLVLARDPLGIKPLYYALVRVGAGADARDELVFASEIPAILAHPEMRARPDPITASAYLTTIRVILGPRTLFAGVRTLLPGQTLEIDLSAGRASLKSIDAWEATHDAVGAGTDANGRGVWTLDRACHAVRACVRDSVHRHLRSDVPVCELLSGGLDSSIIAKIAAEVSSQTRRGIAPNDEGSADPIADPHGHISTYCSGATGTGGEVSGLAGDQAGSDDFAHARLMARAINSRHTEVVVDRAAFATQWESIIKRTGVPLSTPNEVAINAVAARIRADARVVALSGEGADELFAGYVAPMQAIMQHVRGKSESQWRREGGTHQLVSNAWMSPEVKREALTKEFRRQSESDETLRATYDAEFERAAAGVDDPGEAHLRFIRRVNLTGLLLRLDSATMLESIEGRTPIADIEVARLAGRLPMSLKFAIEGDAPGAIARSKIALRAAFAGELPREIVERPKASFPLPFQSWVSDQSAEIDRSEWARGVFTPMLREMIKSDASKVWPLAWPSINLAMWSRVWWE
ncbi:MAG: asparagine synthase (glutamine-hydrolyzing) [Phycisphaerae bacterium]|nr:asparagine synthase (glutamine-hydrolyzing) [Phycisphaerae bacterium]